jgi:hypothetical protein
MMQLFFVNSFATEHALCQPAVDKKSSLKGFNSIATGEAGGFQSNRKSEP